MVGADGRESREDREIERQDFVVTTANKQLNFCGCPPGSSTPRV
jgi:type I restriction enzyme M protein